MIQADLLTQVIAEAGEIHQANPKHSLLANNEIKKKKMMECQKCLHSLSNFTRVEKPFP